MPVDLARDPRIVLTLDAGRTGLKFSAIRGGKLLVGPVSRPTEPDDRDRCLANIMGGFDDLKKALPGQDVKQGDVVKGVVVRTRVATRREDGSYVRFDRNALVLLDNDNNITRG